MSLDEKNVQEANAGASADGGNGKENKAMAVLSYLGPLVLVSYFAAKDSKFVRHHVNQGMVLFAVSFLYDVSVEVFRVTFLWRFYYVVSMVRLAGLVFPVLSVMGIVSVVQGQMKELPVIGKIRLLR